MRLRSQTWMILVAGCFASLSLRGQSIVNVTLLKPWGAGATGFVSLNAAGTTYGPTQVSITPYGTAAVTLAGLNTTNADVIFLSDPAGGNNSFSTAEIAAIQAYLATPGKRLVGTYATFQWMTNNNTALLPLFGLTPYSTSTTAALGSASLTIASPSHFLMDSIGPILTTTAYAFTQTPPDMTWDPADYQGTLVASNVQNVAIVHHWISPSYDAVYISYMPEYNPDANDLRLLYNAMTRNLGTFVTAFTPQGPATLGTAVQFQINSTAGANQPFVAALSLTTSPGIPLGDGRTIPLTPDWLFNLCVTPSNGFFLNNFGTLDSGGNSPSPITLIIPNNPLLIGITIYGAAAIGGGPPPTGILGFSAALPITFQ